ncbi:MAG: hypothetical protein HY040_05795 [Planctomycetes bacterium]|nr:hypothetical protein [Planctomycetota bacterium]
MNSRFSLKRDDVQELPPGQCDLECNLEVISKAPFSAQMTLFIDDHGTRALEFTIHGNGTAAP